MYADDTSIVYIQQALQQSARGKSGPLFQFDVHDDVRLVNDASVEKEESHAGKVLLRSWYERNKHIFPARLAYTAKPGNSSLLYANEGRTDTFSPAFPRPSTYEAAYLMGNLCKLRIRSRLKLAQRKREKHAKINSLAATAESSDVVLVHSTIHRDYVYMDRNSWRTALSKTRSVEGTTVVISPDNE
ncbi:unnamed protein product [Callosobruchus maculatus]|uniref:Protein FAM50 homolog n=1 Tax=Callosobruchus maculatus TaxID=64391 RepID=A0A653BE53_CALMS|nr:unnamed protein product [Callosobruchus maculatus]